MRQRIAKPSLGDSAGSFDLCLMGEKLPQDAGREAERRPGGRAERRGNQERERAENRTVLMEEGDSSFKKKKV